MQRHGLWRRESVTRSCVTPFDESGTTSTDPSQAPGQSSIIRLIASNDNPPDSVLKVGPKPTTG